MEQLTICFFNSVDPSALGHVLTDRQELFDRYFYAGHPLIVVPNYNDGDPTDVGLVLTEWPSAKLGWTQFDDLHGAEFDFERCVILEPETGLISIEYVVFGAQYLGRPVIDELVYRLKGYVATRDPVPDDRSSYVFTVTELELFDQNGEPSGDR